MAISLLFTGHMVDLPNRRQPRFPQSLEAAAKREIRKRVARQRDEFAICEMAGFASAARGGDILFHEICRKLGIKTAIVLPFEPEQFVATSVAGIPGGRWRSRFWSLWDDEECTLFREVLGLPETDDVYRLCNSRVLELAKERGQVHLIAFWDGKKGDGPGGTADLVEQAKGAGDAPDIFSPDDLG